MDSGKIIFKGFFCIILTLSAFCSASDQRTWTPSEMMKLKLLKDVQVSPDHQSALFVSTEALLTEEKDINISRIYKSSTNGKENPLPLTPSDSSAMQPRWSPDGQWIAFISDRSGSRQLYLMDPSGNKTTRITNSKNGIQTFRWAPDSHRMAFVMAENISPDSPSKSDAYLYKEAKQMNRLWLLDIQNSQKEPQPLTPRDYSVRGLGHFGTTNEEFDWSPDGKEIVFAYSPSIDWNDFSTRSTLAVVDLASGQMTHFDQATIHESMPKYSPDGKWISFMAADPSRLYSVNHTVFLYSRDGKKRIELAHTSNEGAFMIGPNLLGWTSDSKNVIFFEPKGTKYHLVLLPADGGPAKEIKTGDVFFKEPSLTYDGKALGIIVQSAEKPPEAFVTLIDSFEPIQISHLNDEFLHFRRIKTISVKWNSVDGEEIEGLLTFPSNYQKGQRYPLLLIIHGGPMGFFDESFVGTPFFYPIAAFAEEGFMVLRPNPRGSTGYGKKFRCLNFGDFGGKDFQDLMTGIDHLIQEGFADGDKLGVMGWSYGGYMTAWAITQTNRFKAASMGAGLCNLVSMSLTTDLLDMMKEYMGDFLINPSLYHQRSPLYHSMNIETPCLIQHGLEDKRVPVSQAYEFYEALKRLDKEVILTLYPRMGHRITEPKMQIDQMEQNLEWFTKHVMNSN